MTLQRIFLGTLIVTTAALLVTRVGIGGRTANAATLRAPDRAGVADRQGPDSGSQYRSAIFFFTAEQEAGARASKGRIQSSGELSAPVVTEIQAASTFTRAEAYHQQYVKNGGRAACHRRKRPA